MKVLVSVTKCHTFILGSVLVADELKSSIHAQHKFYENISQRSILINANNYCRYY